MYRFALTLIILFLACEVNDPITEVMNDVQALERCLVVKDTLTLEIGSAQFIGDTEVEIGFSHIYSDSRCPKNVMCFWQGMAQIAVWLKSPDLDTLHIEPIIYGYVDMTHTGFHSMVLSDRFGISLLQLDPYPVADCCSMGVDLGDTVATLLIEEFEPPPDQSVITLVDGNEYNRFAYNPVDPFGVDSLTIEGDTLQVHLHYSGGCNEHDFYTFGSLAWMESQPPIMPITIIHMGHNDFCDAIIHETIKVSLYPVTQLTGYGNEVFIEVIPLSHRVYFTW